MRVFLTGGTGFIGGAVARAMRAREWSVTALARRPDDPARALREIGVTVTPGDVTESDSLAGALQGYDAVVHLAGWYAIGVRDRALMRRINVDGTRNVLDAAINAGTERIVHCSTIAAIGTSEVGLIADETSQHSTVFGSVYEETKWRGHQDARERIAAGAPITIVMPGGTYGVGDHSIIGLLLGVYARKVLVACPFLGASISLVHVDDVAEGIVRATERGTPGDEFILGGDNVSLREMFARIAPYTGIRAPVSMPGAFVRAAVPLSPIIARVLGQPPWFLREGLKSLSGSWMYSSARAERLLGYTFRTIEEGIPPTVAALRGDGRARA